MTGEVPGLLSDISDSRLRMAIFAAITLAFAVFTGAILAGDIAPALAACRLQASGHGGLALTGHGLGRWLAIYNGCASPAYRSYGDQILLSVSLVGIAFGVYRWQPVRWARKRDMTPLTARPDLQPGVSTIVARLSREASLPRDPEVVIDEKNPTAQAFGTRAQPKLSIGKAVIKYVKTGRSHLAEAVLRHEIAHVADNDIGWYFFAQAVYRVLLVLGSFEILLSVGYLYLAHAPSEVLSGVCLRSGALLALAFFVLRAWIRHREFHADVNAARSAPAGQYERALQCIEADDWRQMTLWERARVAIAFSPPMADRIKVVTEQARAPRTGVVASAAAGAAAGLAAPVLGQVLALLGTGSWLGTNAFAMSGALAGAVLGMSVTVGLWRNMALDHTSRSGRRAWPLAASDALLTAASVAAGFVAAGLLPVSLAFTPATDRYLPLAAGLNGQAAYLQVPAWQLAAAFCAGTLAACALSCWQALIVLRRLRSGTASSHSYLPVLAATAVAFAWLTAAFAQFDHQLASDQILLSAGAGGAPARPRIALILSSDLSRLVHQTASKIVAVVVIACMTWSLARRPRRASLTAGQPKPGPAVGRTDGIPGEETTGPLPARASTPGQATALGEPTTPLASQAQRAPLRPIRHPGTVVFLLLSATGAGFFFAYGPTAGLAGVLFSLWAALWLSVRAVRGIAVRAPQVIVAYGVPMGLFLTAALGPGTTASHHLGVAGLIRWLVMAAVLTIGFPIGGRIYVGNKHRHLFVLTLSTLAWAGFADVFIALVIGMIMSMHKTFQKDKSATVGDRRAVALAVATIITLIVAPLSGGLATQIAAVTSCMILCLVAWSYAQSRFEVAAPTRDSSAGTHASTEPEATPKHARGPADDLSVIPLTAAATTAMTIAANAPGDTGILTTHSVLGALMHTDATNNWERIWPGDAAAFKTRNLPDPQPQPTATWRGTVVNGSCARALRYAQQLSNRYQMQAIPPGLLALGILHDPLNGATAALITGTDLTYRRLLQLIQEDILGFDLEGFPP